MGRYVAWGPQNSEEASSCGRTFVSRVHGKSIIIEYLFVGMCECLSHKPSMQLTLVNLKEKLLARIPN